MELVKKTHPVKAGKNLGKPKIKVGNKIYQLMNFLLD